MLRPFALAACLLSSGFASAAEFDWPGWRGADRTGVSKEKGLLKEWPKGGPAKLWTVKGCGKGYASIAVAGGFVYGSGGKDGKNVAWAMKEADSSPVWETPFAKEGSEPNATVVLAGGRLYALSTGGELACLDAEGGKVLWTRSYAKDFKGKMMSGWGYSETPLIDGDKLICTPGGDAAAVVALDAKTGAEVWRSEVKDAGGAGYASPVKAIVGDVPMYVTLLGKTGGVVAVHAETGKLLWRYAKVSNGTANIPTVVSRSDLVWCSTGYGDGGSALLRIKAEGKDAATVEEVKRYKAGELQNHHGGMVLVGDNLFFGEAHNSGHPACVDFKTGEILYKDTKSVEGGSGSAAVVYADGMLYYRYDNGLVALIEANPEKTKVVGSFKLPEPSGREQWQHPVVANGRLYLRDQDKLHCYDVKAAK